MKVIATFNIKGGVGKTATSVNLAYLAAADGVRTLLWDLDPQGAASFYFRIKPKIRGGAKKLINRRSELLDHARESDYELLDVVPADFSFRKLDLFLDDLDKPRRRLRELLTGLEDEYDLVILDCAPSISLVSEAVFEASAALLSPTIPTTLSLRTLTQVRKHLAKHGGRKVPVVMPFFSMVDRRKALHRETCEWAAEQDLGFLETQIPYASVVEQMGLYRAPLGSFASRSAAAIAYAELWREVRGRVGV